MNRNIIYSAVPILLIVVFIFIMFISPPSSNDGKKYSQDDFVTCPGGYQVILKEDCPPLCNSDSDCTGYCGEDECLMAACQISGYEPTTINKYCGCLGLCGFKR